jgi:hypothetical protein
MSLSISLFLSLSFSPPSPISLQWYLEKEKNFFISKKLQKSEITTDQMDTIKVAQNSVFRKGLTIMNIQNIQYLWLRITQFVSSDSVYHNLFIKSIILVTQSMDSACTCIIFIKTLIGRYTNHWNTSNNNWCLFTILIFFNNKVHIWISGTFVYKNSPLTLSYPWQSEKTC